jgi:hypothetical protein
MYQKGMKLKPKQNLKLRLNIEDDYVYLESIDGNIGVIRWGKDSTYSGFLDFAKDFYLPSVNEEVALILSKYDIKDASLTTIDGKQINIYI